MSFMSCVPPYLSTVRINWEEAFSCIFDPPANPPPSIDDDDGDDDSSSSKSEESGYSSDDDSSESSDDDSSSSEEDDDVVLSVGDEQEEGQKEGDDGASMTHMPPPPSHPPAKRPRKEKKKEGPTTTHMPPPPTPPPAKRPRKEKKEVVVGASHSGASVGGQSKNSQVSIVATIFSKLSHLKKKVNNVMKVKTDLIPLYKELVEVQKKEKNLRNKIEVQERSINDNYYIFQEEHEEVQNLAGQVDEEEMDEDEQQWSREAMSMV